MKARKCLAIALTVLFVSMVDTNFSNLPAHATDPVPVTIISVAAVPYVLFQEVEISAKTTSYKLDGEYYKKIGPKIITGADLSKATSEWDANSGQHVLLKFTPSGQKKFAVSTAKLSQQSPKGLLGIFVDGILITAPSVYDKIEASSAIITGKFTATETNELATEISRGILIDTAALRLEVNEVTDFSKAIKGFYIEDSVISLYVGNAKYDLATNSTGYWSKTLDKALIVGTKITVKIQLNPELILAKYMKVKPRPPTINKVTSKSTRIFGKSYSKAKISIKVNGKWYAVLTSSAGDYKFALKKPLKKGSTVIVKVTYLGVVSSDKIIKVV